jgi:hypothetical protein
MKVRCCLVLSVTVDNEGHHRKVPVHVRPKGVIFDEQRIRLQNRNHSGIEPPIEVCMETASGVRGGLHSHLIGLSAHDGILDSVMVPVGAGNCLRLAETFAYGDRCERFEHREPETSRQMLIPAQENGQSDQ